METPTNKNAGRSLSTHEVNIIIAEAEDRLMRLVRAQTDVARFYEKQLGVYDTKDDWSDEEQSQFEIELKHKRGSTRVKYDIPSGVYLFYGEGDEDYLDKYLAPIAMKFIRDLLRGKMTPVAVSELLFCFEEIEFDWRWVIFNQPAHYYSVGLEGEGVDDFADYCLDLYIIGTRKKATEYNRYPLRDLFGYDEVTAMKMRTASILSKDYEELLAKIGR